MKKNLLLALAAITSAVVCLCACSVSVDTKAVVTNTYIGHHQVSTEGTTEYQGQTITYTTTTDYYEQLQLLDDSTYAMTQVQASSNATYYVYATGSFTMGEKNAKYDGYTEIVLENATYVDCEQDIYGHMFSLSINSETSTFPHEIAGGAQLSKEDFLATYGEFGNRYIRHQTTITDTAAENWIDVAADVEVVE